MKILPFLLAVFTFVMSVIPCCWDDMLNCDDWDNVEEQHTPLNPHSSCPDGHCCCSPFSSCNGCTAFVFEQPEFIDYAKQIKPSHNAIPYIIKYVFNTYLNIWQPPKIMFA